MESKVLIVGYGVVGKNLYKELCPLAPSVYDKYLRYSSGFTETSHDVAFICVDTPLIEGANDLDIAEVRNAINDNEADIYVIKSTCPVGTVDMLKSQTGKSSVYSPEYYGDTQHCNNYKFDFTVLGGDKADCIQIQQLLQNCYDARHIFRLVDAKTAELVKFMENSWLATKVSFCNQFYNICQNYNVAYEDLRELFILDPRVNPSHTFVYSDHPYWDSHCLNKDVPHIAYSNDAEFLEAVIKFNEHQKA